MWNITKQKTREKKSKWPKKEELKKKKKEKCNASEISRKKLKTDSQR